MTLKCVDGPMDGKKWDVDGPQFPQRLTFLFVGDSKEHEYNLFSTSATDLRGSVTYLYRQSKQGRKRAVTPMNPPSPEEE